MRGFITQIPYFRVFVSCHVMGIFGPLLKFHFCVESCYCKQSAEFFCETAFIENGLKDHISILKPVGCSAPSGDTINASCVGLNSSS